MQQSVADVGAAGCPEQRRHLVLFGTQSQAAWDYCSAEEDRDRVRFTAIEGRSFTRSGQIWQAFEPANPPVAAGCYQSDESGFPMCIGRDADDEEPIDPVLTATLSPKSYGTPGGNSILMEDVPAIFMANCRRRRRP